MLLNNGGKIMEYFKKGSEWRKWDLHLHTPSSFDYKGNPTNEEIIQTLKDNEISAAVITDHHFIDVDRITKLAALGKKKEILILPGIELRSELGGKESVHFIGIFPIENIKDIWDEIKVKLKLQNKKKDKNWDKNVFCPIKEACDLFHQLNGITTIHAGSKTNSIENVNNKHYLYKIKQRADLLEESINVLEIGKEKDIEDYNKIVFKDIGYKVPLIVGSDNHNINNYNLDQNCWIKSDLTFEGLKQIIYEPEERVKIQEVIPDKKYEYAIIESVKFEDDEFISNEISLNSNLVSIIGGRSTGKSIFLRSIARAIDKKQVDTKCKNVNDLINPITIVKWKNGNEDTSEKSSEKKIIYIPQNFLNNQITESDPDSFSYNLINDILKSDNDYKLLFSNIDRHKYDFETNTHNKITKLYETEDKLIELKKQLKELGNPEDVQKEKEKLMKEYNDLQSKDVSEEDKKQQEKLIEKSNFLKKKLDLLKNDDSILSKSLDYLTAKKTFIDRDIIQDLSEWTKNEINFAIDKADSTYKNSLIDLVHNEVDNLQKDIKKNEQEIITIETKLIKINEKLNSSQLAEEIFKEIKEETIILSSIKDKEEKIKKMEEFNESILKDIFNSYNSFIKNLEHEINNFSFSDEYANFKAELRFKSKEFQNSLENSLDKRKFKGFEDNHGIDLYEFNYDEVNFLKNLETLIKSILNGDLKTKSSKSSKNVIKELLGVYHFINFNIIEDGEELGKMSPGKRSFALLKVLIESDKSRWPILLDQPEDDLDAKSISERLSTFLKEKKKKRQIIIVSHNPNLVVGADSEQVIIANQDGTDLKNMSKRFEYISGSIENSFIANDEDCHLYKRGIKEHICDILEGGEESFKKRQYKYNIE